MEPDSWPRPKTLSPQIRLIIMKKEKENTRWRKERELTFCSEPKTLLLGLFWLSKYAEFQNFPRSLHKSCNTHNNSILLLQKIILSNSFLLLESHSNSSYNNGHSTIPRSRKTLLSWRLQADRFLAFHLWSLPPGTFQFECWNLIPKHWLFNAFYWDWLKRKKM